MGEEYEKIIPKQSVMEQPISQETMMQFLAFGQMMMRGCMPTRQYTVAEWIDHVIESKAGVGRKRKTISGYRYCAIRIKAIIGDMPLHQVQPSDISDLYAALQKETKNLEPRAELKKGINIWAVLAEERITKTHLAHAAGISQSTTNRALNGYRVFFSKAEAIANILHRDVYDLFNPISVEKPLTNGTLKDYQSFLSLVFSAAERELYIPNPVKRTERISTGKKHNRNKTLQLDEVRDVLAAADKEPIDKKCLIHLFLITGCRRGEIAGLRWSNVYWDIDAILIDSAILYTPEDGTYSEDSTKGGQDRIIRLPKEAMDLLREYQLWQNIRKTELGNEWIDSDYVFTRKKGGEISPDTISGYISRFEEKYSLPHLHPHKFRHTHASILLASGMDVGTLSRRLGHSKISTTLDFYAHELLRADMECADELGQLFYGMNE